MDESGSRQDILRVAGLAGILFGSLLILQMVFYRLAGADVYTDSFESTLVQILDHRTIFTLSGVAGALGVACTLPAMLGFLYTFDRGEDRPFFYVACAFVMLSALLLIDAYAHYGNLVGTALDYTHGAAPRDVVVLNGDTIGDQFEILQFAGLVSFGVGLLIVAWLLSRSEVYQKPLAWLTFFVGVSSFFFTIVPALFIAGRLVWAFSFGATWFRASIPQMATVRVAGPFVASVTTDDPSSFSAD